MMTQTAIEIVPCCCLSGARSLVQVGVSHHSRNFPSLVQYLATKLVREAKTRFLQQCVPALGLPSDLEIIADGGAPDHFHGRNRSTVVAVGVVVTCPDLVEERPESAAVFLSVASEDMDARGGAVE